MNELIICDLADGVLTLTLNRPDKLNALTNVMYSRLADLFFSAGEDPGIRAILLTGGTQNFTSGNDLHDFLKSPPSDLDSPAFRFMRSVIDLKKPLVAAVCGAAIGIGTTLLLHCDYVVVSRDAKLRMPFVNLGLCPEFGASLLLPKVLGHARTAQLLLLGESLAGEKAVEWGLANEVLASNEQCLASARQVVNRFLAFNPASLHQSKRLLKRADVQQLRETIREENLLFIELLKSEETRELLRAMLQRSSRKS